jgi:hypothetical protein
MRADRVLEINCHIDPTDRAYVEPMERKQFFALSHASSTPTRRRLHTDTQDHDSSG